MRVLRVIVLAGLVLGGTPGAAAQTRGASLLIPPVDAAIERRFEAPERPWGSGHRGVDYAVAPGIAVRAAAAGTVTFAGTVAGAQAVTIDHGGGVETTYSVLSQIHVRAGEQVARGRWIGRAGQSHPGGDDGLHFGVKVEGVYVDPEQMLGPVDLAGAIHLAPLAWQRADDMPGFLKIGFGAGTHRRACEEARPLEERPRPPSGNVAVAVAGLASKTRDGIAADMYEAGPEQLGYPASKIYRFSYSGHEGSRLHRPYDRVATYGDIRTAARRLGALLRAIASRHPGAAVDLFAHSQGGLVARAYLELVAQQWDPRAPRVDHLVTFGSPHRGAPLAAEVDDVDANTVTGSWVLDRSSDWARGGGPLPDPRSVAVEQLAPGSPLLGDLAREDVLYGTRVLSLATPHDVVVPADRARWSGHPNRVVAPTGINGHSGVVHSALAQGLAYDFVRGAGVACKTAWDLWGPRAGRAVSWVEGKADAAYDAAEQAVARGLLRGAHKVGRLVYSGVARLWR